MNLFEVEWRVVNGASMGLDYRAANARNKKAFTTREKAEEFYKSLFDAAGVLSITGMLEAQIHEVKID